ncbi:MAG: hypothetical protein LBH59_08755 [Planctomycetaceae bacterium]|jgi:hypothetical protein|nr:hypothetical protein [Planctomycetaceae bacterium]
MNRINVTTNRESREFAKISSPVLFIEGGGADRFDINVMESLFDGKIKIEPLGSSVGVRFASQAFQQSYPYYFFLVDRDTCSDQEVEQSWKTFGTENGNNLLILHKREIENYFLDPDFLCLSQYLYPNKNTDAKTEITNKIIYFAQKRLFVDVLNFVIISCREKLKKTGIELATMNNIKTEKDALQKIEQIKDFDNYIKNAKELSKQMRKMFCDRLKLLRGNSESLQINVGKWQDQMEGKEILNSVLSQGFFKVKNNMNKIIQNKDKTNRIIKDLLKEKNRSNKFPQELLEIKEKIIQKINR